MGIWGKVLSIRNSTRKGPGVEGTLVCREPLTKDWDGLSTDCEGAQCKKGQERARTTRDRAWPSKTLLSGKQWDPHCFLAMTDSDGYAATPYGNFLHGLWTTVSKLCLRCTHGCFEAALQYCCSGSLTSTVLFSSKAADGLVCAHIPDGEAEEEPVPEPRRARGHPSGHPESRAAGHPGAAADWVSTVSSSSRRARAVSRAAAGCQSQPARVGRPQLLLQAPWNVDSCELGVVLIQNPRQECEKEPRRILDLSSVYPPARCSSAKDGLKRRLATELSHLRPSRRRPPGCAQPLSWPLTPIFLVCLFIVVV